MAKLLGISCVYLKKCSKVAAPPGFARDDGYDIVGATA